MNQNPPNIVLIMADQLAPQFTGTYGHPLVKTPHMDALAERGARFDWAYCNSPLCAPSRFSFMAGQLITNIAAYDNASEFPSSILTFSHYLRAMGYQTCLAGKMHFVGPDQLHGFEERVTTDIYPSNFAWTPNWELPDERIDRWYHNMDSVFEAGCSASTFQIEYDEEVSFSTRKKLIEFAQDPEKPFCLVASFIHPHDPYVATPEWWNLYEGIEIDLPRNILSYEQLDPFSQRIMKGIESNNPKITEEIIKNARRGYYANMSYFDSQIGMIVRTLQETKQSDNTIIILVADHGEMLGERGLWYKMNFFEPSGRIPLIMAGPGIISRRVKSICSLVDVLPTLVDIGIQGGMEQPEYVQEIDGRSLLPLVQSEIEDGGEAIGEYCAELTPSPVFMIRRDEYKFIYSEGDPPLLYNLKVDPDEMNNLTGKAEYALLLEEFENEAAQRWDIDKIKSDIIAKQKQRHALYNALEKGKVTHWDYNPPRDASKEYVRTHMDWKFATERTRVPPFKKSS